MSWFHCGGTQPELTLVEPYGTRLPLKLHALEHLAESFLRTHLGLPLVSGGCLSENCYAGEGQGKKIRQFLCFPDFKSVLLMRQGSRVRRTLPRSLTLAEGLNSR